MRTSKFLAVVVAACSLATAVPAQETAEAPVRIEFEEFLTIAGEDIAREFASCAGYYAVWAATTEAQGNAENAAQLKEITQYAIDIATESARGVRSNDEVDEFVRAYIVDTANSISRILSRPGTDWSTIYEIYDEACKWALDNQELALEQWTARTAARLREQGYELGDPPPVDGQ